MSNGTKEAGEAVAAWAKSLQVRGIANIEYAITRPDAKTEVLTLTATLHVAHADRPESQP